MNGFILVIIKLLIGFFALILIINISGKRNLAPSSVGDQVQNYVLGGIIGGVIYNNNIRLLDYIGVLCIWCILVLAVKSLVSPCEIFSWTCWWVNPVNSFMFMRLIIPFF